MEHEDLNEETNEAAPFQEFDEPEFISPEEAVEVAVDDNDVPMDEDEDIDPAEDPALGQIEVEDMSKFKIDSHNGPVYAVTSFLEEGNLTVVSGGGDDKSFWHRVGGTSKPLDHAHTDSVTALATNVGFTDDKTPRMIATGSYDGAICIYDADTGAKVRVLEGPTDVEWLAFHPKGGSVLLAGSAADSTVWMYHHDKVLQVFVGHESAVTAGAFTPDGRWAVSTSADGTVRIWAPRTGASKHVFRWEAGLTCLEVDGGVDGQLLLAGGEDGVAHVCHVGSKKEVATLRHYEVPSSIPEEEAMALPMSVEAVGFAPKAVNPNWVATGGMDGVLKIWDLTNDGQCRQVCQPIGENQGITRLRWHASMPIVFTATTSGAIHIWDARNGAHLHSLTGNQTVVNDMDVKFPADGRAVVVVSAGDDNSIRIFEVDVVALLASPVLPTS